MKLPSIKNLARGALITGGIALALHEGKYYLEEYRVDATVSSFINPLVEDIKDGTLDSMISGAYCAGSFFLNAQTTSALDLHAITREEAQESTNARQLQYEQVLDTITAELDTYSDFSLWSNQQKWEETFRLVQQNLLLEYDENWFDIGTTLETGGYNCNSATQLFAAVLVDLDTAGYLDAKPLRFVQFGNKKEGHVIIGYADNSGYILHYFENTNPENYQDPRYKKGRILTLEEFVTGYLYGMAIDTPQTRELVQSAVVEDLSYRFRRKPNDIQIEQEITNLVVTVANAREHIKRLNRKEQKYSQDPFLFPPMGYDLDVVDVDDVNYAERAEVWLALHDLSRAQYLVDLAYNRAQISDAEYGEFERILDAVRVDPKYKGDLCIDAQHHSGYENGREKLNHNDIVKEIFKWRNFSDAMASGNLSASLHFFGYDDVKITFFTELTRSKEAESIDVRAAYTTISLYMEEQGFYSEALDAEFAAKELTENGVLFGYENKGLTLVKHTYNIGVIYNNARDKKHAKEYFHEAEQRAMNVPESNYLLLKIAKAFYQMKDYNDAQRILETEVLPKRDSAQAHLILGNVLSDKVGYPTWMMVDLTKARDSYETALALGEEEKNNEIIRSAHYSLAMIYGSNQILQDAEKAEYHREKYKELESQKLFRMIRD